MSFSQALSLAALIAAGLILWNLRQWLLLLFAAIVLALALCSLVDALQRRVPMRRPVALLASLSGLGLLFTVLMAVLVPPFIDEFALLLQKLPQAARALLQLGLSGLDQVSDALYGVDAMPDLEQLGLQSQSILPDTSTLASGVGSGLIGLIAGALLPLSKAWSRSLNPWLRWFQDLLAYDFYTENFYRVTIVNVVARVSRLASWFDRTVVDGLLNGVARLSLQSAEGLKLSVSGQSQSYVLTVLVAIVLFLTTVSWFLT